MSGNEGQDKLCGEAGNDTLYGGKDDDTLVGEEDIILDFTPGQDLLQLNADLTESDLTIESGEGVTIIRFRNQILARLDDIEASLMSWEDFMLMGSYNLSLIEKEVIFISLSFSEVGFF